MASGVRFVENRAGFIALRNSEPVQALCLDHAQDLAASANSRATYRNAEYAADVRPGRNRCHSRAYTANEGAWWNEMRGKKGSGPLAHSF